MEFVIQMDFLERLITCRLCECDESRRDYNNDYIWITDKDRYGQWTGEYICYDCRYLNNRYCFKCGREDRLLFHYDINGLWDGRRICTICLG